MRQKTFYPFGIPPFESHESWAKKSVVTHLVKGEGEDKRLVGIKVVNELGTNVIPVMDSRYEPEMVKQAIKSLNSRRGSKFFNPSYSVMGHSYNVSRK